MKGKLEQSLVLFSYQIQEWRREQKGPTGTSSLDDVAVIVAATLVIRSQFTTCLFFTASLGSVTYLTWFMDDGKPLTLQQTCEEGGGGGGSSAEAPHPGASRISTASGSQQVNLSARWLVIVSVKQPQTAPISRACTYYLRAVFQGWVGKWAAFAIPVFGGRAILGQR